MKTYKLKESFMKRNDFLPILNNMGFALQTNVIIPSLKYLIRPSNNRNYIMIYLNNRIIESFYGEVQEEDIQDLIVMDYVEVIDEDKFLEIEE